MPLSDLPRSHNPEKGYIVIANSRQAPDTSKYDYGSTIMCTARQQRIVELLEQGIRSGKKFTVEDMKEIQFDVEDVHARGMLKNLFKAVESVSSELSGDEKADLKVMTDLLSGWNGSMDKDSVAASVYSFTMGLF